MSVVFLSWCGVSPVVRRSSKQPWILWCVQVQISPFPVSCRWAFHCHHRYSSLVPNYAVWKLPWSEQALFVSSLPSRICSYIDIICILESLDACRICIGNSEEKFLSVVRHRNSTPKGECLDVTIIYYYNNYYVNVYFYIGQDTGVLEAQITSTLTVRHKECQSCLLLARVFGVLLVFVIGLHSQSSICVFKTRVRMFSLQAVLTIAIYQCPS